MLLTKPVRIKGRWFGEMGAPCIVLPTSDYGVVTSLGLFVLTIKLFVHMCKPAFKQ